MGGRKLTRLVRSDCVKLVNYPFVLLIISTSSSSPIFPTRIIKADTLVRHSYYFTCRIDIGLNYCFTPSSSLIHCFPTKDREAPRPRQQKACSIAHLLYPANFCHHTLLDDLTYESGRRGEPCLQFSITPIEIRM